MCIRDRFMKAAHIDEEEVLNKDFWQMEVEDNVFLSHDKHPNNKGYAPDMPKEPLSRSRRITVLIHGFYLSSKKLFELEPEKFEKRKPLVTCSSNLPSGWRIYFSFYD